MRKNKTMKGGRSFAWDDNMPVFLDKFKSTGYGYASNSLFNTRNEKYKLTKNQINSAVVRQIKTYYRDYWNKIVDRKIIKYEPDEGLIARAQGGVTATKDTTFLLEPAKFDECITYITSGDIDRKKGGSTRGTDRQYVDFGRSFKQFAGDDISGSIKSVGSAMTNLFSQGVSAAPDKLNAMKAMAKSPQAAAAKAVALQGAQNVIGSVTSGKYSGAASEVAGSLLKNTPGTLGAVARYAPGIAGTVAIKAAGTAASFAAADPSRAMAMAKKSGLLGSKWPL